MTQLASGPARSLKDVLVVSPVTTEPEPTVVDEAGGCARGDPLRAASGRRQDNEQGCGAPDQRGAAKRTPVGAVPPCRQK